MTRFRAAAIHLAFSGVIVSILLLVMLGLWYPGEYFPLMGGMGLLYLIVGIDICLGPLLTLLVFKPGKKSLKFDLSVIAFLQIAALSYGTYTMFISRPVFTAYNNGEFQVATASEVSDKELKKAIKPEWRKRPVFGPITVAAIEPEERIAREEVEFIASAGAGMAQFPRLFVDYSSQSKDVLKTAKPLKSLHKTNNQKKLNEFFFDHSKSEQDYVYLPIKSRYKVQTVILDAKTAEIIKIIDIDP